MKRFLFTASLFLTLAASGQDLISSRQIRRFDVTRFGVVAGGTNNNAALANLSNLIAAAGSGEMFFPKGVYVGKVPIPASNTSFYVPFEITGEGQPSFVYGTVAVPFTLATTGTVLMSSDVGGAIIGVAQNTAPGNFANFSQSHVVIRNIEIRAYDNPNINGIDLSYSQQARVEDVFVNSGSFSVDASNPTNGKSGIIMPANNNGGLSYLKNVLVTGFYNGIVATEHTEGYLINVACNYNGIKFIAANHSSYFSRVSAQRNTNNIYVAGAHRFTIAQLNIEHANPASQTTPGNAWQVTAWDVKDTANLGHADITWAVVKGAVQGFDYTFTKTGGATINVGYIGETKPKFSLSSPTNGQAFVYDAAASTIAGSPVFKNGTVATTGGGSDTAKYIPSGTTWPILGNIFIRTDLGGSLWWKYLNVWSRVVKDSTITVSEYANTEAESYFTRLTTAGYTATTTEKVYWDNFVTSAKSHGYYPKLHVLYNHIFGTQAAATLNAISSSFTATVSGTVTFGTTGATGNGTNGYINSNYTPSVSATLNSSAIGAWVVNSTASSGVDMGAVSSTTAYWSLHARFTDGNSYLGMNTQSTSNTGFSVATPDASGMNVLSRISNTSGVFYQNGVSKASKVTTDAGTRPTNPVLIFAQQATSGGAASLFSARTHKMDFISTGLTSTEVADFYNDYQTFLNGIGR